MTEDELLDGITGALTAGGWLWHHVRRSDRALTMGTPGFPDIVAVHPDRKLVFVAELKADVGRLEPGQAEWLEGFMGTGVDVRLVRPSGYDATWRWLVGDRLVERP